MADLAQLHECLTTSDPTQCTMSGPTSSSASSVISGLGINFCPSPDPSALRDHLANNPPSFIVAQQSPSSHEYEPITDRKLHQPHLKRTLRGSVSYDAGMSQYYAQQAPQVMIRDGSGDSYHSGNSNSSYQRHQYPRPSMIPAHHQQYHQKQPEPQSFYHHLGVQHLNNGQHLSPLSEFDPSSDSESQVFSPASLSSLPSSSGHDSYGTYEHQRVVPPAMRHAQSMISIPFSSSQTWPVPPTNSGIVELKLAPASNQPTSYLRPHPMQDLKEDDEGDDVKRSPLPAGARSPSRLPQFLQDRVRRQALAAEEGSGQRAVPRAQSMMELNRTFHHQQQGIAPSSKSPNHYADDERRRLDEGDNGSPESVPSSAGGLQRRHLERRLQEQHTYIMEQAARERAHRKSTALVEDISNGLPMSSRRAERMRSKSMGATDRIVREEEDDDDELDWKNRRAVNDLRKSDMGARRRSCDAIDATPETSNGSSDSGVSRHDSVISTAISKGSSSRSEGLQRQSTLLTAGANPFRRSLELDRLLAPNNKRASVAQLATIAASPVPSTTVLSSSGGTPSTRARSRSNASSSALPIVVAPILEQGNKSASKVARVELDLVLNSSLVVEGGLLKGKMDVRVRKQDVWVSKPKVRVVGFEELSSGDARHIFYHHATIVESTPTVKEGKSRLLPFCENSEDKEGFHKGRVGEHSVPFSMSLPIGKGAKGGWKCKQGVVRYIVIASVKLKAKDGNDRSIAHFYRHIDIFPYHNPAILLAPATKALVANASKGLFMGGNGKVNLEARLHRAAWVAGQRCYVDIKIENESNKKIKSLTLSLIRTTSIFRSTEEGSANRPSSSQSTKKKVAESTLEMGKKGTKGVTAKGSWIGVEAGETADFSHSLLVPSDELSIARGRHLQISYALKVSAAGSLSADVNAEIPIRIVNFVSLDPPPGHLGSGSPLIQSDGQSLAKSWSKSRALSESSTQPTPNESRPRGPMKMKSLDSLKLSDLFDEPITTRSATALRPRLSRVASVDSICTADLSRAQSPIPPVAEGLPLPTRRREEAPVTTEPVRRGEVIVGKAIERQLTHQMSIECITSAIASATARRQGHQRTESGLRSVESHAEIERWEDTGDDAQVHKENEDPYFAGGGEKLFDGPFDPFQISNGTRDGIQLDDLDDVPDDMYTENGPLGRLPGAFSSEDELQELNLVMQQQQGSRFSDDEEEEEHEPEETVESVEEGAPVRPRSVLKVAKQESETVRRSSVAPSNRSRPSSPVKPEAFSTRASIRKSESFAFATPSSPIKATLDVPTVSAATLASPGSPVRRQPSKAALQDAAEAQTTRAARPLPVRPTQPSTIASPTKASIARAELTKKASVTSLKRSPGVVRRPSNKALSEAFATSPILPNESSKSVEDRSNSTMASGRSPTISIIAPIDSPRASSRISTSPRKVIRGSPSSPNLRTARSIGDLRVPRSPRREAREGGGANVLPSVRSKVAALETRSATLTSFAGSAQKASFLSRDPMAHLGIAGARGLSRNDSVRSEVSDATTAGFGDLTRANSVMSFKAPMLRRK